MSGFNTDFTASGSGHNRGTVPDPGSTAGNARYLREDAIWAIPGSMQPATPPPASGPTLDQWACNVAGYLTYEVARGLVKVAVDLGAVTWAADLLTGIVLRVAAVLLPEEYILGGAFSTYLAGWLTSHFSPYVAQFTTALADDVLWAKIHCQMYSAVQASPTNLAAAMVAAASGISAISGIDTHFASGLGLILQNLGINSFLDIPTSALVQQYDCSTCGTTGIGPTQPVLQKSFDLSLTDGTTTDTYIDTIQVNQMALSASGTKATLTPKVGVKHGGSLVADEPNIEFVDTASVIFSATDVPADSEVEVSATVPIATSSVVGLVKPDNLTTSVNGSGVLQALFNQWPVGYGVLASRPGASLAGRLYYATDTDLLYRDNGSSWDTLGWSATTIISGVIGSNYGGTGFDARTVAKGAVVAGTGSAWGVVSTTTDGLVLTSDSTATNGTSWQPSSGGGGRTVIEAYTVSGSAVSSKTFSSIPGSYTHLELEWQARSDRGTTDSYITMQLNGDTGAHYNWAMCEGSAAGNGSGGAYSTATPQIAIISGNSAPSSYVGSGMMRIPWYAGTQWFKTWHASGQWGGGTGGGNAQARLYSGEWTSLAAITALKLISDGVNGFQIGSTFTLYGIS
jgi:hypothetical protein